ncbi:MAG: hypothetical protein AAGI37_06495 [Planctomycetota bacterium]
MTYAAESTQADHPKTSTRGVVTIATGPRRYRMMAHDLALSIQRFSPSLPIAVITDSVDDQCFKVFDRVIKADESFGDGFLQKLSLHRYTLWDEVLFIDCDCLVVGDLESIWDLISTQEVGYAGERFTDGVWYGVEIGPLRERIGLNWIGKLNSGAIYYRPGAAAAAVFDRAAEFTRQEYATLGFPAFKGTTKSDEPGLAVALAEQDIPPVHDSEGVYMRTPIGIEGPMHIDIDKGGCSFLKAGTRVTPIIAHFATWTRHPVYLSERVRLRLLQKRHLPSILVRFVGFATYYVLCLAVRINRIRRAILKSF